LLESEISLRKQIEEVAALRRQLAPGGHNIYDRVNFVVVAKAPIEKIREWGRGRGWNNLRLLSSNHNTYNRDYLAEIDERGQMPAINIFQKDKDRIRHFYCRRLRKRRGALRRAALNPSSVLSATDGIVRRQ